MPFSNQQYIRLDSVDSTNNYAANLLKLSTPPDGTVITARNQTQGRGQRGTTWQSNEGENLLMSLICYPKSIGISEQFYVSKCAALAVAEMTEDLTGKKAAIKWPNDIFVEDQKIAGILIELQWSDKKLASAIIGIGLNVNQTNFDGLRATSLKSFSGKEHDLTNVTSMLSRYLEKYYIKLISRQFASIDQEYRNRLYRLGVTANFTYAGEPLKATIVGVDAQGKLRVAKEDGSSLFCDLKEISMQF
jgi:BirA family biotin operon repressor/biotin-[acetyl-CoA-carboxylase] ligase